MCLVTKPASFGCYPGEAGSKRFPVRFGLHLIQADKYWAQILNEFQRAEELAMVSDFRNQPLMLAPCSYVWVDAP